ncbi:HPF/RaiA family ribosome-associated protein [Entomospira culicis]|uniref:HPF/RaiA family ribosome-associated protein n=1 Tax=Entomospira culicis TaxID=2719989 RepID=A0A968KV24_9SPIO|nr:HPF/RaiA family ribosome-associated protein [Entomospira culicis]NIZ19370.1 HPF/RaiA family ribosome-associated protein [Entomospira culicis]NIZ69725.1 HPF/RaiA family ribosome-associated protein [Entomospira culicis]WDI36836.1 HPF/RaiA family ribosome-associated protein [Entomospira culicis]WDI38465.1 HPF/RaiA family ribosome-associated protein [Entomospira culicis]
MDIEITGVHYHVSDATKEHIHKKMEHWQKMAHTLNRIHLSITPKQEHHHETFEVHLHAKLDWQHAPTVDIRRHGENLWAVIDETFEGFSHAVHKHKDKHTHVSHDRVNLE